MSSSFSRLVLLSLFVAGLSAQMRPNAPIQNFRYPVFGDNGYRIWELRGVEGRYLSDEESLILGMDLKVFSGDESMTLETRIRSPEARINFPNATAEGSSTLFVTGQSYEIEGSNWKWEGKAKCMTVVDGSRVVFFDSIDILK
jgi:hypothetical protein|tara:strand:+ start:598 stop:1026 length:429 start_codon:yes stop_codon:yes gene_type:complete